MKRLINSINKDNTIILTYTVKLGLKLYHNNVKTQKTDNNLFKTFKLIQTSSQKKDKLEKAYFFKKSFIC